MKLDIKNNMLNMEIFFKEVLGYNCCWKKDDWFRKDLVILYLEVPSFECFLKYIDKSEFGNGKIPSPDKLHVFYDGHPPCHRIVDISSEDHELYTDSGIKRVYDYNGNGMSGITKYYIRYFLYCYDRKDSRFQSVPVEIVKEIEDFLKSKKLKIYDEI